jgi:hypothetical protein
MILNVEFLILDWMEAELIAQKCGGPAAGGKLGVKGLGG